MIYNKLVRDRIPELIRRQGGDPVIRILEDEEYTLCLERKLDEETAEFHEAKNLEELADILEVVFALAENMGASIDELMDAYQRKHADRGGFRDRVFLISNEDKCL